MPVPKYDPLKTRKHWPIVQAYWDTKLSRAQAEAQLRDLGMIEWEIALYLDDVDTDDD